LPASFVAYFSLLANYFAQSINLLTLMICQETRGIQKALPIGASGWNALNAKEMPTSGRKGKLQIETISTKFEK